MRILLATSALFIAFSSSRATAQDSGMDGSKSINIGISAPYGIIGEYVMGENWSLGVHLNGAPEHKHKGGGRHKKDDQADRERRHGREDKNIVTRYGGLLARYNLTGRAFDDGFYMSGSASYIKAIIRDREGLHSSRGQGGKGDVLIGYGWFANNGLNIHLGIGAGYSRVRFKDLDFIKADGSEASLRLGASTGGDPPASFPWDMHSKKLYAEQPTI